MPGLYIPVPLKFNQKLEVIMTMIMTFPLLSMNCVISHMKQRMDKDETFINVMEMNLEDITFGVIYTRKSNQLKGTHIYHKIVVHNNRVVYYSSNCIDETSWYTPTDVAKEFKTWLYQMDLKMAKIMEETKR